MITRDDLQEAIAECEGVRNPNANTCIKLAAFYTIRQHMFGEPMQMYSFAEGPSVESDEKLESGTEFAELSAGIDRKGLLEVVDELMSTLSVLNPRLYASVIRKLKEKAG